MTMTYVDNILEMFDSASDEEYREGMTWYNRANALAWELDHLRPAAAAGVIAVLSPLISWNKNAKYARMAYDIVRSGDIRYLPCLKKNANKAFAIVDGGNPADIVSGPKVTSFWNNIVDPYSDDPRHVTIDAHAWNIARGGNHLYQRSNPNTTQYREAASAYVVAAHEANILPLQMQAVTWTVWRNL